MPLIESAYNPSFLLKNGHISTIYAGIFRKIAHFEQKREKLELADGDFLDLDWSHSKTPSQKVVILFHGLEGNAQRAYILGSAKIFNSNEIDVCAVNFRGCSGVTNRLYRSYHAGATEDLKEVIQHLLETKNYSEIYLKGFSLGGNVVLKYLGETATIPDKVKAAVAISVPCDLRNSLEQLLMPKNVLYARRFKKHLKNKLRIKLPLFPEKISLAEINNIKTLKDFDDLYTSRAHGFIDAYDYYEKCSSRQFLPNITIPTLLINAQNDSFIGHNCYPTLEAKQNPMLFLETPKYGGHVGFFGPKNTCYTEIRAIKFIQEHI